MYYNVKNSNKFFIIILQMKPCINEMIYVYNFFSELRLNLSHLKLCKLLFSTIELINNLVNRELTIT